MYRLLKIELIKLFNNRMSKFLIICYFLLITLIAFLAFVKIPVGFIEISLPKQGIFNFPYIWHFNTYIIAILKIFFAIVIVSMMSNEYSYNTLKQNLIDGLSKKEFLLTKIYTIVLFVIISTLLTFIITLILGYNYSTQTAIGVVFSDLEYLLAYAVKLFSFFSFCLLLGILIKRSAFALGFFIFWQIAEWFIYVLLKWQFSKHTSIPNNFADKFMDYMPLGSLSNLIKEPFTRLSQVGAVASQVNQSFEKDYSIYFHQIIIVLLWAFIFNILSYSILKKRDL